MLEGMQSLTYSAPSRNVNPLKSSTLNKILQRQHENIKNIFYNDELTVARDRVTAEQGIFISFYFLNFLWWSPLILCISISLSQLCVGRSKIIFFLFSRDLHTTKKNSFTHKISSFLFFFLFFHLNLFSLFSCWLSMLMFHDRDNMKISTSLQETEIFRYFFSQCVRLMCDW